MGSAVDKTNLTHQLEMFQEAGIGGVEICPIYGAHGYEDRFIQYLSPQWMEMLAHTTSEAKRLGLGVDLTTGTGWPFGGPRVPADETSGRVVFQHYDVAGGAAFTGALPQGNLQCLHAVGEDGTQIELSDKVSNGKLNWTAPPGKWRLYAVSEVHQVQKVKRAAPGGEGYVLDPFSVTAMSNYLADFDRHFAVYHGAMPRSGFHDSYEYYSAEWTPAFFTEFAARRGYDLRTQLPAFFDEGPAETATRVRTDYRETIGRSASGLYPAMDGVGSRPRQPEPRPGARLAHRPAGCLCRRRHSRNGNDALRRHGRCQLSDEQVFLLRRARHRAYAWPPPNPSPG